MPSNHGPDHFLRQFDRYPEGEARFAALAAHASYLLNSLVDERKMHTETVQRFTDRLAEVSPIAALMRELCDDLSDKTSDQ